MLGNGHKSSAALGVRHTTWDMSAQTVSESLTTWKKLLSVSGLRMTDRAQSQKLKFTRLTRFTCLGSNRHGKLRAQMRNLEVCRAARALADEYISACLVPMFMLVLPTLCPGVWHCNFPTLSDGCISPLHGPLHIRGSGNTD